MLLQSTTITFATFLPRPAVSAIASSLLHPPICLMTSLAGLSLHLPTRGTLPGASQPLSRWSAMETLTPRTSQFLPRHAASVAVHNDALILAAGNAINPGQH